MTLTSDNTPPDNPADLSLVLDFATAIGELSSVKSLYWLMADEIAELLELDDCVLYLRKGEFEKSVAHHQRALEIREKIYGSDHPEVAKSLHQLATSYIFQVDPGKFREAADLLKRALRIRQKKFSKNHPAIALTLESLALLYKTNERDGKRFSERAKIIRSNIKKNKKKKTKR